ncbi:MAG: nucleotide exchange factor GrpE [Candidatus Kapaibacteriota bacterium]
MEDGNTKKPLKQSANKARDIYNTYLKFEGGKTIPITPNDSVNEYELIDDKEKSAELEIEQKDRMHQSKEEEIQKLKEEISKLEAQIEQLTKEKSDLHEQLLRKAAEFENFRRRTQKEKEEIIKYGNEKLLAEFLSILDDLGNAVENSKKNADFDSLAKGIELIWSKTKKIFEQAGVVEIESPVGKPFDVDYHDALMTMPSDLPEGYVVQELQKGYKFFDKVLRHTKVITSSGLSGSDGKNNEM